MPNMYARGILFGKMVLELGDTCTVRNDAQGLYADLEFKTKGFFSGVYNAIAGRVKRGSTELGEVNGKWSALMEFKTAKVRHSPTSPLSAPIQNSIRILDSVQQPTVPTTVPCPRAVPSHRLWWFEFFFFLFQDGRETYVV